MTWFKSFSSCVNELYVTFRFWATRHRQTDRQGDVHNGPPRGGHHNKRMTTTGCCDCWTFAYRKTWTPTSDSSAQREVLSSSTGKSFSVTYFLHSSLGVDIVPSLLTVIIELVKHDSWPIQPDILSPPLLRLTSRKPLWLDLQPVDIKSWRRHNWKLAQVVQLSPSVWPHNPATGFRPPLATMISAEPFSHGTGTLRCLQKEMVTYRHLSCPCGETQTMSHVVESRPLTKLNGGLSRLHSADEDAVSWLTNYGKWHAYEKKKIIQLYC